MGPVSATVEAVTVRLTPSQVDGYWLEEWFEDGSPFGDPMLTPLHAPTPHEHAHAAARRLATA